MINLIIIAGIFTLDLVIKNWIEKHYEAKDEKLILNDRIRLRKLHNYGAAMNILQQKPKLVGYISGGITACVSIGFVLLLFKKGQHMLKTGISFLLGGALSNLYDRWRRGYVVDYFSFQTKLPRLKKMVFNLSDMFIFAGAFLSVLHDLRKR